MDFVKLVMFVIFFVLWSHLDSLVTLFMFRTFSGTHRGHIGENIAGLMTAIYAIVNSLLFAVSRNF